MTIQYDEKGKFYTDVITKTAIPTIIQTTKECIHGNVHVRHDERFKDEMDREEKFLAVTDAIIYSPDSQILYQCDFLSIQKIHIVWAIPKTEITHIDPEPGAK